MIDKFLATLRDPAWQGISAIVAVLSAALPLIASPTIAVFLVILFVILFGIFIYAKQNDVSLDAFYSVLQIVIGFTLGGMFIVFGKTLIGLPAIIILSMILIAILARLTARENLKVYYPFMFSIIAGCVVLASLIFNESIPKENFPILMS